MRVYWLYLDSLRIGAVDSMPSWVGLLISMAFIYTTITETWFSILRIACTLYVESFRTEPPGVYGTNSLKSHPCHLLLT